MNIHKFSDIPEKPFHSSAYAETANGGSIGSTNSQTFGQRYDADQNRFVVRKYGDSHIGRGSLRHQARPGMVNPFHREPIVPTGRQSLNATDSSAKLPTSDTTVTPPIQPHQSFKEPPTRGFNPYA